MSSSSEFHDGPGAVDASVPGRLVSREESARSGSKAAEKRRRKIPWFIFQAEIPLRAKIALAVCAWVILMGAWYFLSTANPEMQRIFPTPVQVVEALGTLFIEKAFIGDVWQSITRIGFSFLLAVATALPIALLMGAFPAVDGLMNPIVSPFRYLPAPSFIPFLLAWLGTGDEQKVALLFLGVIWFLISLLVDDTKRVPLDYIRSAQTLGAGRRQVLFRVILPSALPHYLDTIRQMLAVSWTYLVIAEIVAATDGIGAVMMRAKRFVKMDDILACILVIGVLGFLSDILLRGVRWYAFPYLRQQPRG
ncbi:MAG: ABC transporter permease [Verrucomicrobiota bacterium]